MIKHHPTLKLLKSFVGGDLPASLLAGIAIHADMCPVCQVQISQLTDKAAEDNFEFEEAFLDRFIVDNNDDIEDVSLINFEQMLDDITATEELEPIVTNSEKRISFKDESYVLPAVLHNMSLGKTAHLGKLSRARIQLDEDEIHTSLLHIEPGGSVPEHTHKGFELTLLLDGSFEDEFGKYVKGDFIMVNGDHQHHPISKEGCLCYTIANDALRFTQGINKLLNPIGSLIY